MRRERILTIARGHVGDIVRALPALRDVRQAYPDAHVAVLLSEYVRGALEGCPYVDELIYGFAYRRRGWGKRLLHQARALRRIVGRFDTVIALGWSPRSAPLLAALSGARVRVGFDRGGPFGGLWTHNLGREPQPLSVRLVNLRPLRALAIPASPAYPRIDWLPGAVRQQVSGLLARHGVAEGARYAVLQVSSHWGCNEWRSDKWAALADYLIERHGLRVVVTGTAEAFELAKFREIAALTRHELVSLHGQTSLRELFEVVGRAALVVATDSALTQVVLAQRTPSVVLFHTEPIEYNGPLAADEGARMQPIYNWDDPDRTPPVGPHCRFGQNSCHGAFCRESVPLARTTVESVKAHATRLLASGVGCDAAVAVGSYNHRS